MKSCLIALSFLTAMTASATADPIANRQAAMKEIGGIMRQLAPFAQGAQPYDAAAVNGALAGLDSVAKAYDVEALFPEGSESGDTKASPAIWQDRAGYEAAVAAFKSDVAAAVTTAPQDVAAFAPAFGEISSNCGACHRAWRQ